MNEYLPGRSCPCSPGDDFAECSTHGVVARGGTPEEAFAAVERREALTAARRALTAWKQATLALDYALEQARVSEITDYPEYLPSFDEFALEAQGIELPR